MARIQTSESLTAQFARGLLLVDEGIQCMDEADPNSGIGARITGSQICDNALSLVSDTLNVSAQGELLGTNVASLFALKQVFPEAFHWYLAQNR